MKKLPRKDDVLQVLRFEAQETDVEKALAYRSGSGCAGRHDSVWRRGESIVSESMESVESKTELYRAVRVSLEEQEAFLLGKQQAEELQELAGEIEESNIRALLQGLQKSM